MHIDFFNFVDVLVVASVGDGIVLVAELEISFHAGGRMLRTLTVIAVRQQHDQAIMNVPFGFARYNELIDNDLSSIGKITKLGLPKAKCIWISL